MGHSYAHKHSEPARSLGTIRPGGRLNLMAVLRKDKVTVPGPHNRPLQVFDKRLS